MNTSLNIYMAMFALLALSLQPVYADDDTGYYAGVSINRLSADFENVNDVDFGGSDNAGGLRTGYMFNDSIGVELGYIDLGNYEAEGDNPGNRISLDAEAFSLAVVINYPVINHLDLYGRIGVFQIDVRSNSVVAGTQIEEDDDQTNAYGAFGVEWDFGMANIFFEFSYAETDVNDLSISLATVGFKYEIGK